MKYLVFVETGGEMECAGKCSYMYYTICEGNTELEILKDWKDKNNFNNCDFYQSKNGNWTDRGYMLQLVPLYNYVPENKIWQTLKWI